MSWFVVDVEADGPAPGIYSMIALGAVRVDCELKTTFKGRLHPITSRYDPKALYVSGYSRGECLTFPDPVPIMREFRDWIKRVNRNGRPTFVSDNVAFDWQFVNYYFHKYLEENPFGWSGRRIGDLFCGVEGDCFYSWKKHRRTAHDHDPVNDATANAEALLYLYENKGLNIPL